ncbi:energy transducer TonB [Geopsychrobacter electrodiphilus]|uniref:energy transducer TonB n=1 Tax=Geopsychrobacter electrodiphilus TaxID=225196 RepID=UPI0003669FE3|nr:TonB family protein [Geopsychrobacter electrodiphilus]
MKTNFSKPLRKKSNLFGLFLLVSMLLHLLAGFVLQNNLFTPHPEKKTDETLVALQERKNWLELDQKPLKVAEAPPKEATHIAEANQQVKQETAPKATDHRDQKRVISQREQPAHSSPKKQQPQVKETQPFPQDNRTGDIPLTAAKPMLRPEINLPDLKSLTNLSPLTQARLDRQQDRPEIQLKGDEVWLNLREDDKLISFFRRFRDRIEAVWNYPAEAASKGIQGTLLIKIVVNKKGELLDALPLESSGSDILDYEAIQAIYRAAPFGALPSYYKYDQLKIYAHFQYNLSRSFIYGQP